MTVGVVLNILNHSAGRGEAGLVDEADELVLLPPVPFRINHQGKSVLKAELAEGAGVLHLALKLRSHTAKAHGPQCVNRRLVTHRKHLLCGSNLLRG